ncbi:MAG: 7-cyano-7-deazaguanine synthase [Acidobacteria bacterium]|nr:7-cyano-7-deazaguanine synthase [Acidobacteriota bacterium]MCA1650692.1 7-cyano-7-deazaguanine synthase [Acidobacteriota bacterium]
MVALRLEEGQGAAVLFSAGLDSAVLLAQAARQGRAQPVYVRVGLAWEDEELALAERLLRLPPFLDSTMVLPMVVLAIDMRDVYPAMHWAMRGDPPGFDTPDEDVYLEGRNVILLSKAGVFAARAKLTRILIGTLAGNPFPDARPQFFHAMGNALTLGLGAPITIEAPLSTMGKSDVIRVGRSLGVPLELTMSCMRPSGGAHCGRCSKCRERRDGFRGAGVPDLTVYEADRETGSGSSSISA